MLKFIRAWCGRRRHSEELLTGEPEPEIPLEEESGSPASSPTSIIALALPASQPEPADSPALRVLVERVPVHIYRVQLSSGTTLKATHQLPDITLDSTTASVDLRIYVVWAIPGWGHRYRGVHWARGLAAYQAVLELNNQEFRGIRWQRVDTFRLAFEKFIEEASEFNPDQDLVEVFGWRVEQTTEQDSWSWLVVRSRHGGKPCF